MLEQRDSEPVKTIIPYALSVKKQTSEKDSLAKIIPSRPELSARSRASFELDMTLSFVFVFSVLLLLLLKRYIRSRDFYQNYIKRDIKKMGFLQVNRAMILHYLLSFAMISSFLYELFFVFGKDKGILPFLHASIIFSLFLVTKILLVLFTAYFFEKKKAGLIYLEANLLSYKLLGLILIPVIFTFVIFPNIIPISIVPMGIVVYSIVFIVQIFFGLKILLLYNFSKFHTFLYLCTLEIAPLLYFFIIVKEFI